MRLSDKMLNVCTASSSNSEIFAEFNMKEAAWTFESVNPTDSTPKSAEKHISIRGKISNKSWRVDEMNLDIDYDWAIKIPTIINYICRKESKSDIYRKMSK